MARILLCTKERSCAKKKFKQTLCDKPKFTCMLHFFSFTARNGEQFCLFKRYHKVRIFFAIADCCKTVCSYTLKVEVLGLNSNELEEANKKERTPILGSCKNWLVCSNAAL